MFACFLAWFIPSDFFSYFLLFRVFDLILLFIWCRDIPGLDLVGVRSDRWVRQVWVIDCKGCGQDCKGRYGDTPIWGGEGEPELDEGVASLCNSLFFEKTPCSLLSCLVH